MSGRAAAATPGNERIAEGSGGGRFRAGLNTESEPAESEPNKKAVPGEEPASSTSSLRVMFVIPGKARGHSMVFARRQAHSLTGRGVTVDLFHLGSRTSAFHLAKEFVRFRRQLERNKPQVIHAHFGTVTALFAALAAPFHPLVITYRGSDLNAMPPLAPRGSRLRAATGRLLSQLAALRARRIICVSAPLRDRLWWRKGRVLIYPSGVDETRFFPEPQWIAREKLGWPAADRVVLFNSAGSWWIKRPDLARAAVERARLSLPELRLEILDGTTDPARVPALMNASDCLLLTSDAEGSPTVVQEALACNLPIVAVKVGDTEEILRGVAGTALVERDPEAIAQALLPLVTGGQRSAGHRKVSEFSATAIAQALCRIYNELSGPE